MLATLRGKAFIARVAAHTPLQIVKAKAAIRRAFELQAANTCFTLVEVLSTCPTNWGMAPNEATDWLENNMVPYFKLGVLKSPEDFVGYTVQGG